MSTLCHRILSENPVNSQFTQSCRSLNSVYVVQCPKKNAKFLFVENMLEEILVSQTNEKKSFDIPITSEILKVAVFEVSTLYKHDLIDD